MKGNLIAAAGAFVAAVAVVGMAGPANAGSVVCELSVEDNTHTLSIDKFGVYAGRRDAGACKDRYAWDDKNDHKDHDKDHDKDHGWGGGYDPYAGGWGGGYDSHDSGYHRGNGGWDRRGHDHGHNNGWGAYDDGWSAPDNGWKSWGGWSGYRLPSSWRGRY
jgi:hypothetical protein